MAEEIRNRRLHTELENVKKVNSEIFNIEQATNILDNGIVLTIKFNLKDHPYNSKLLTDRSELSLMKEDPEGDNDDEEDQKSEEQEFSDEDPIDECEDKEYTFDLIVPKKFPFTFPEVRTRWDFSEPSIMDERDVLEDMLGKPWHPFIIIKDIIERLPQYVYKVKKRQKDWTLYYRSEPNYNLNSIYDLSVFKANTSVWKAFACDLIDDDELIVRRKKKRNEEIKRLEHDAEQLRGQQPNVNSDWIDKVEDERFKKYIVVVSDNSFLLFERPPFDKKEDDDTQLEVDPADLKFTMGKLILWGTITSIEQLKRNMEFKDNISIVWSKPVKNDDEFDFNDEANDEIEDVKDMDEPLERVFETCIQMPNSDDFMMVVLEKMSQIKENTKELTKKKILSNEVTKESFMHKNVKSMEHQIQVFEKEYQENPKDTAPDLMDLYRKAIEYYSAIDSDKYKTIVEKIKTLSNKMAEA